MKFYLASRYGRRAELRGYAEDLQALGHEVTSRWLWEEPPEGVTDDGLTLTGEPDVMGDIALRDLNDIDRADHFILFAESERSVPVRGGRHTEFGFMFGLWWGDRRPRHFTVIGPRENVFHWMCVVNRLDDWPEFMADLLD